MQKYVFIQNNSGGEYDIVRWTGSPALGGTCNYFPHSVGEYPHDRDLWVMAKDEKQAMEFAEHFGGLYFDGVDMGFDCECCGDRWSAPIQNG